MIDALLWAVPLLAAGYLLYQLFSIHKMMNTDKAKMEERRKMLQKLLDDEVKPQ